MFVNFNNKSRIKVTIPNKNYPNYPSDLALKNAAFRIWTLTKKDKQGNDILVYNNCKNQFDNGCFDDLYKRNYESLELNGTKLCYDSCKNSSGSTCYDCLRKNYGYPICSRDNFAIKPERFNINIIDNNQTYSKTKTVTVGDGIKKSEIAAEYLYRLDINATIYNLNDKVKGYYFNANGDNNSKKAIAKFNDSLNCNDKSNKDLNIIIFNGKTYKHEALEKNITNGMPVNGLYIDNSGKYKLLLEDKVWTQIDQQGYKYKPFKDEADCILDSTIVNKGLNDQKGCDISAEYKNYKYEIESHPYNFDITEISVTNSPNKSQKNMVYINDLNLTKELIKSNKAMALKIEGIIYAKGKRGGILTNYHNQCSARDLTNKINYSKTPNNIKDSFDNDLIFNYSMYENSIDSSVKINKINSKNLIDITFNKKYFNSGGLGVYSNYFNFKRDYNNPINPFKLNFFDFSISSPTEVINVDLENSFIPKAKKDLNSSRYFYYAKVKSQNDLYDDIYDTNITTPIEITIFCNKSIDYCKNYGIDTDNFLTNEYDWWISQNHNANLGDGKVYLKTDKPSYAQITPNIVTNFINGIDKNVMVKLNNAKLNNRPFVIEVQPTSTMIKNAPWILYNKYQNTPPRYIYKIKFAAPPAAWSGEGKTGHTINVKSNARKTKKVDW
jgi:hypothetical protein